MIRASTILVAFILSSINLVVAAPSAGDSMTDPATGMAFVWVPQGCFEMGGESDSSDVIRINAKVEDRIWHNGPGTEFVHENSELDEEPAFELIGVANAASALGDGQVCFAKGFWMGKYEVTQAQYQKMMGTNPSGFKKGDHYPVERVRWFDAQRFIRELNKATGKKFRLPSEAEWEYAAGSGGQKQQFGATGSADKVAWYMNNSGNSSHPVGRKKANGLGLHDMSGNVWEWTQDCWNEELTGVPKDGSAWNSGVCTARVLRGGSWYDAKTLISTTARLWNDTDKLDNNSGFRLVHD